ncbi:hypothetical protein, partial [Aeromonas media]|uniref:hypothetical protein n=1 Tax=Aeromonas media TaxID=651 RepID=UPI003CFC0D65
MEFDLGRGTVLFAEPASSAPTFDKLSPVVSCPLRVRPRAVWLGIEQGSDAMGNGIGMIVVELGWEVGGTFDRGSHIPDPRIAEISQDAQLIGRH